MHPRNPCRHKRRDTAIAGKDDATCKSYGLSFGTPAYAQCRQNLVNQREATARALIMSRPQPPAVVEVHPTTPPRPMTLPAGPASTDCRMIGNMLRCTSQ